MNFFGKLAAFRQGSWNNGLDFGGELYFLIVVVEIKLFFKYNVSYSDNIDIR